MGGGDEKRKGWERGAPRSDRRYPSDMNPLRWFRRRQVEPTKITLADRERASLKPHEWARVELEGGGTMYAVNGETVTTIKNDGGTFHLISAWTPQIIPDPHQGLGPVKV